MQGFPYRRGFSRYNDGQELKSLAQVVVRQWESGRKSVPGLRRTSLMGCFGLPSVER